jgi:hypothetical protein
MAVSVDIVYKTVLSILNKEQRGYMTPDEFNRVGNQVQLEIFESYFEDLNQQLRIQQTDDEYANRQKNIDNKISVFKTSNVCSWVSLGKYFSTPTNLHKIGTVIYNGEVEVERVQKNDFIYMNLSQLTKPTKNFPVYLYEYPNTLTGTALNSNPKIYVHPLSIQSGISVSYIRKPTEIIWAYSGIGGVTWTSGPYIYNATNSINFELDASERTNIIIRILSYAGMIIRDQEVIQAAVQKIQSEEINSKN